LSINLGNNQTHGCLLLSHAAAGWHPKRFEFEPEWDNDAETSIADIEFREEDSPQEVAAKLRLLEIYNLRLDEVRSAC
jgi:transcriptional adapter 2-alpha